MQSLEERRLIPALYYFNIRTLAVRRCRAGERFSFDELFLTASTLKHGGLF